MSQLIVAFVCTISLAGRTKLWDCQLKQAICDSDGGI
jgi:hypothetical protein